MRGISGTPEPYDDTIKWEASNGEKGIQQQ